MSEDKTEKPTPKRREEARKKGQVAKSQEVNTALVLGAGIAALAITAPGSYRQLKAAVSDGIMRISDPSQVSAAGIGDLFREMGSVSVAAGAPIVIACTIAGVVANIIQSGFKITPKAAAPNFKRMDPIAGAKRVFGKQAIAETIKAVVKTGAVSAVAFLALWPILPETASLVGLHPADMMDLIGDLSMGIATKVIGVFVVVAVADYIWQRRTHEKSLKMTIEEVKKEAKESDTSPEMKQQIARKRHEMSRRRMLSEVPTADVVVVNPTHFAVALRYDGKAPAPQVVAKGQDLIAAAIRKVAEEHGVPVLANPPLARALHREVEIGHMIPEELFAAVAEVLAFVYRTAGRRAARRRALGVATTA
jgi:flagellar biosynthetic protein FlhB